MRVVQELSEALQRETQPRARARLELRLAVIAARQGRFDESLATVARVRAEQAGAGIVADSDPAEELLECRNKAAALLSAIPAARRMTRRRG